jgi:Flp pilus assembly protein TadG
MLSVSLLMLGGISIDLWSALGAHRDLAGIADAAAAAGASGVDTDLFRGEGLIELDESRTRDLAFQSIGSQPNGGDLSATPVVAISGDGGSVTVTLRRQVDLTLLRLLVPNGSVEVSAEARSDASLRQ